MNNAANDKRMDLINIMSFLIGVMNLDENLTQGDKQDLIEEFNNKANYLLNEIHQHLERQDKKMDEILTILRGDQNGVQGQKRVE